MRFSKKAQKVEIPDRSSAKTQYYSATNFINKNVFYSRIIFFLLKIAKNVRNNTKFQQKSETMMRPFSQFVTVVYSSSVVVFWMYSNQGLKKTRAKKERSKKPPLEKKGDINKKTRAV